MKTMEREVCVEMALLEENEPVLTTQMKQRGGTHRHTRALRSARAAQSGDPCF